MKPQKTETAQQVRLVFEAGPMAPYEAPDSGLPGSVPPYPYVAFSTGVSWTKLAAYYGSIVEEQIRNANLDSIVRGIIGETTDRDVIAQKLLAWIQRNIRYTGLRLGQAPIAPMKPAETLEHKYGDCKDKSALFVAMLREAGISSHIALLRTGPGLEVESGLPGLSAFDHTIVYISGIPPLWIDPTDEFARLGELPSPDQDRLALIAEPATADLVRTPAPKAVDNLMLETREFFLSDIGSSRVIETTEWHGEGEREIRGLYRDSQREHLQTDLNSYAEQTYISSEDVKFEHSDPMDLSQPFRLRLEIGSAEMGASFEDGAFVAIPYGSMADRLPWEFWYSDEPVDAGDPANGTEKRKHDYVFQTPFVTEWRYRIVPPPGLRADPFPENETIPLGSAKFSKEFAQNDDGVITVQLRFDSGKRQISAAEFRETQKAIGSFADSDPLLITYTQVGMEHLESGRIREAIDEFRRLENLYPDKAHYQCLMANALIEAGLGDAARKSAQAAVEMEPESSYAYQTLGFVLQHDSVGRMFKKGFDYDGALAAYKKAKELDPDSYETIAALAILVEHDRDGNRYSKEARLDEEIEEYRGLPEDVQSEYAKYLMAALMESHRFAELKEVSESFEDTPQGNQMMIMATAMTDSSKVAINLGRRLFPVQETRRDAYEIAGGTLSQLRCYPEAADLLREAAKGAVNSVEMRTLAEMRLKTRRYEDLNLKDDDPATVVKKLLISMFLPQERERYSFSSLFVSDLAEEVLEDDDTLRLMVRSLRSITERSGVSMEFIVDTMLSNLKIRIDGDDDTGYKIQMQAPAAAGAGNMDFFVVKERDSYRILGLLSAYHAVGREAIRRIENLDMSGASQLLNWVRDLVPSSGADDPFGSEPFLKLWPRGSSADELRMRIAAASLMADSTFKEQAKEELLAARSQPLSGIDQASIDHALALAYYNLDEYEDLLTVANKLYESHPESQAAFLLCTNGMLGLKRYSDARRLAEERLKTFQDDPVSIRSLASIASKQEDWEEVDRLLRRLADSGKAASGDYNNLAWNSLFRGNVTEQALEDARYAVTLSRQSSATSLHTLATLYAETGKIMEAREAILLSIEVSGREEPESHDWFVFGRIAEDFDLVEAAASAYAKVKELDINEIENASTYKLAQKRLKALKSR